MRTKASKMARGKFSLELRRKGIYRPLFETLESRLALATVYGVTAGNTLVSFDSATPGTISTAPITGLVGGDTMLGIDFRPATGQLFALTNGGRLYTLNQATGVAILASTLTADPADSTNPFTALSGTSFGVDFNPVPDRLRVVSDTGQNLRINVDNGLVITDDNLNPGTPSIGGAAYTNSFAGATSTTLYGIDSAIDTLVIQNPPNNGTLATVGTTLGVGDITSSAGFDIQALTGGENAAFAALSTNGTSSNFYTVNLTTGIATLVGGIGSAPTLLVGIAVVPETDLLVTKIGPATVTAGQGEIYTVTVTNNGPSSAQGVTLTDIVPANSTPFGFSQQSGPAFTLAFNGTDTFTATTASFAAGETAVFLVGTTINADAGDGSSATNTATVTTTTADPIAANNTSAVTSVVQTSADLQITKTDTPDPVNPGQNVSYTITVTNSGPSDAQNVVLSDTVPAGTSFVSASIDPGSGGSVMLVGDTIIYSVPTLAAGASVLATLTVNVNASISVPSTITNIVTVVSDTPDPFPDNNSHTETTLVPAADLTVLKTGPATVTAGQSVIYTVTITNSGPNDAQNVVLTDVVPANSTPFGFSQQSGPAFTLAFDGAFTFTASAATFAAGATAVFVVGTTINADAADGSTATNTATIASDTTDPIIADNSSAVTSVVLTSADLEVVKVDAPDPVAAGANVTYTITVTNAGPSDAQNVVVTDTVPAGTTFVSASIDPGSGGSVMLVGDTITYTVPTIAAGASVLATLTVNVNAGTSDGTVLSNTVFVSSDTSDPDPTDNSSTRTTAVGTAFADLSVTKTDIPDPVEAGENVTYTITLTNAGPSDAQNVSLTDAIPANTTFVSFTAPAGFAVVAPPVGGTGTVTATAATFVEGALATFTLVVNVNASTLEGATLTNTATASSATTDPTPGNDSVTETTVVIAQADLSVTKTDSPDPVLVGTNLTYTITVTNVGPSDAQNVALNDAIPANTTFVSAMQTSGPAFTLSSPTVGGTGTLSATTTTLAAGGTATFELTVHVNPAPGGTVTNTAIVSSSTSDTNAANNSVTETTSIDGQADLSITKSDTPNSVEPGANLTYTIVLTNNGGSDAQSVALTDAIPAGTTFVSLTAPAGFTTTTPPVGGTGTITATTPTLAGGASVTFTLVVRVASATPSGTNVSNTASVTSTTPDPILENNSDTETSVVQAVLPECEVTTLNSPDAPGTAKLRDDADNPGTGVLIVTGTSGNDVIVIEPRPGNSSQVRVKRNGQQIGIFNRSAVQHIVAFGLAGDDIIIVNASLSQRATLFGHQGNDQLFGARGADGLAGGLGNDRLFGGSGNDTLCGGGGNDFLYGQAGNDLLGGEAGHDQIFGEAGRDLLLGNDGNDSLFGGSGNDRLFGQAGNDRLFGDSDNDIVVGGDGNDQVFGDGGRDLLIGGRGGDTLFGETQDDILVAGLTVHDNDEAALRAILAEWTSSNGYNTRVNNIRSGGGANGVFVLNSATVSNDGLIDTLWGDGGFDWFLFSPGDKLKDRAAGERLN
jgi:uncharacterized repeat protein (TIGR01451 family)